jgi:hypothetical protein
MDEPLDAKGPTAEIDKQSDLSCRSSQVAERLHLIDIFD